MSNMEPSTQANCRWVVAGLAAVNRLDEEEEEEAAPDPEPEPELEPLVLVLPRFDAWGTACRAWRWHTSAMSTHTPNSHESTKSPDTRPSFTCAYVHQTDKQQTTSNNAIKCQAQLLLGVARLQT